MYQPNLPQQSAQHKRQEKLLAWVLTILLHLLVLGGGLFWYFQQQRIQPDNEQTDLSLPATDKTTPTPAESTTAPTVLQAEIDTSTAIPAPTTQTTAKPSNQITPSALPAVPANSPKSQVTSKTITTKTTTQPSIDPNTSPHTDSKTAIGKNEFPVNGSTTTQTTTNTTPIAYGSITTTTTNRITTVAPEINQALTDRDVPASERRVAAEQTSKHLSDNAKKARQLSKEVEQTNTATTQLIETVKHKNQANIDSDHSPANLRVEDK